MEHPIAIAMWDYSWILRHHKYGEFEDWDLVLDGLVERGYNGIRIDCFPHLIAADSMGNIQEEFLHVREAHKPAYWGNQHTMRSHPRKDIVTFLSKCKERGIYIGLSTWFMKSDRVKQFTSTDDFVRAWDETLTFLDSHQLLDHVVYVDLLNEYPLWHGFEWFKKQMNLRGNEKLFKETNPDANVPDEVFQRRKGSSYTALQEEFFQGFIDEVITKLNKRWPEIPIFVSFPGSAAIDAVNPSLFGAIDPHYWFSHYGDFNRATGAGNLHNFNGEKDAHFETNYKKLQVYWGEHQTELSDWMEDRIQKAAAQGEKYNIPVGNTEGWGAVFWQEHPLTDWEFIKNAANIAVPLAIKHKYTFICTSNFTHPQFKGLWDDIEWHQEITGKIRSSKIK